MCPPATTMTKDDIQLLYEYDGWANNRVLQAVSVLTTEQFTRDLGGSFRSVRDTLLHIIGGAWIWLAYWKEPSPSPAFLTDLRTRRDALFEPDTYPNVAAVQLKWAEVEEEQTEFVNRVTSESLETMLPFRKTQVRLAHLMQHLANHSTYHRGQIALMMRQLNAEPLATDFHMFWWKAAGRLQLPRQIRAICPHDAVGGPTPDSSHDATLPEWSATLSLRARRANDE
jgi:uncharacterized damage-inducible protein DinB